MWFWIKKKGAPKIATKKVTLQTQISNSSHVQRPLEQQPRVRVFWTRNNNLGKKQQQLLISESFFESFSWNRSFLNPFLENILFFWWILKQKHRVHSCCKNWSTRWNTYWNNCGNKCTELMIWHALGKARRILKNRGLGELHGKKRVLDLGTSLGRWQVF